MQVLANGKSLIFLILAGIVSLGTTDSDGCSDAVPLGNPARSVSNELDFEYDFPICDSGLTEGLWYRFDAGDAHDQLAEKCPNDYHCGTLLPIWMNGTHPNEIGSIKTVKVCGSFGMGECCGWSTNIQVNKCSGPAPYYVYQLADLPFCDAAYCTDSTGGQQCEPGFEIHPTTGECVAIHPMMTALPTISTPKIILDPPNRKTPKYFVFECNLGYTFPEKDDGSQFEVTFTFNGHPSPSVPPVTANFSNPVAVLRDRQLKGNLGKTIKCSVVSYWNFDKARRSQPMASRDGYFAGIETSPGSPITMDEGEVIEVHFVSTVPIFFPNIPYYRRRPALGIRVQGNSKHSRGESCQVRLQAASWIGADNPRNTTLRIKALPDIGTKNHPIQASTYFLPIRQLFMDMWSGYKLNSLLVNIKDDTKSVTCKSIGDPHITSFDGKYYHNYLVGDFLLWKSTDPALHFEIHVRQMPWQRRPAASANCAVAVREHNTILGIDRCRGDPARFITFLSEQSKRGYINRINSHYYEIVMASGVYVKVWFWETIHLSVHAVAPAHHYGKTEGLCGSYNGDKTDDFNLRGTEMPHPGENQNFPNKFSESYRIHPTKSFFTTEAKCVAENVPTFLCECKGLDKQANERHVECGLQIPTNEVTTLKAQDMQCDVLHRHKRSPGYDPQEDDDSDDIVTLDQLLSDLPHHSDLSELHPDLSKPTPGGITMQAARARCLSVAKRSSLYAKCISIVNVTETVESCATDAMLADTYETVNEVKEELATACLIQAEANLVLDTRNQDDEFRKKRGTREENDQLMSQIDEWKPTNANLRELQMLYCPSECSGRGECIQGTCNCHQGSIGEDCRILDSVAPTIGPIQGDCDLNKRACKKFRLKTANTSEIFSCKFRQTQYVNGKLPVALNEDVIVRGEYVTVGEVICHFPGVPDISPDVIAVEHTIAISNDGLRFGNDVAIRVHDSRCQTNENGRYHIEEGYCVIERRCFSEGEAWRGNENLFCHPVQNRYGWSEKGLGEEDQSWKSTQGVLILIAVLLVAVIIGTICFLVKYFRNPQRKTCLKKTDKEANSNFIIKRNLRQHADDVIGQDNPVYFIKKDLTLNG